MTGFTKSGIAVATAAALCVLVTAVASGANREPESRRAGARPEQRNGESL